jgi:hypothetical protein
LLIASCSTPNNRKDGRPACLGEDELAAYREATRRHHSRVRRRHYYDVQPYG